MAAYTPRRTSVWLATITALILVLAFGNSSYSDWANKQSNSVVGDLLRNLAWPHWAFSTDSSIRTLLAEDLRAILVVVLTAVFVSLVGSGPWSGARGAVSHFLHGWAAYMFAGALAGLLGIALSSGATALGTLGGAVAGVTYGLLAGWIVGLVTLAADK